MAKPSQITDTQPALFIPVFLRSPTLDPPQITSTLPLVLPLKSPVQRPNALPLRPVVCPLTVVTPPTSPKGALGLGQPWQGPGQGVPF